MKTLMIFESKQSVRLIFVTHKTLSLVWDNASGCIDMMPFLLRSLHKGQTYGSDTPMM